MVAGGGDGVRARSIAAFDLLPLYVYNIRKRARAEVYTHHRRPAVVVSKFKHCSGWMDYVVVAAAEAAGDGDRTRKRYARRRQSPAAGERAAAGKMQKFAWVFSHGSTTTTTTTRRRRLLRRRINRRIFLDANLCT